jgi:hypothetical protein
MSEEEKVESYIANCKCCLLAQAMKTCSTCRFNIGLAEQVTLIDLNIHQITFAPQLAVAL